MVGRKLLVITILSLTYSAKAYFIDQPLTEEYSCANAEIVDGNWGDWSNWSICSVTCDSEGKGGVQVRRRECSDPIPKYGGKSCEGKAIEEKRGCNSAVKCPVNGNWSDWRASGECSSSCGEGMITYIRECNNPSPKYCGNECAGNVIKVESCKMMDCPTQPPTEAPKESCERCFHQANIHGVWYKVCPAPLSECEARSNEASINQMYTGKGWFFLHCAPGQAWCKPCASKSLVYNPKCGACTRTRDEDC